MDRFDFVWEGFPHCLFARETIGTFLQWKWDGAGVKQEWAEFLGNVSNIGRRKGKGWECLLSGSGLHGMLSRLNRVHGVGYFAAFAGIPLFLFGILLGGFWTLVELGLWFTLFVCCLVTTLFLVVGLFLLLSSDDGMDSSQQLY